MTAIWKFLTSRNTAIVLLIVVSSTLLVGASLPNPALMSPEDVERMEETTPLLLSLGERFNSMKIGSSLAFGSIGILLIVSTLFCSIDRIMKKRRTPSAPSGDVSQTGKCRTVHLSSDQENIEKQVRSLLQQDRWKLRQHTSGKDRFITATKGDAGFWGSIFFHAILVTLIAGIVVYYLTGFSAMIRITEGQELTLSRENLSTLYKAPPLGMSLPPLQYHLKKFTSHYVDDRSPTDYAAHFEIMDRRSGKTWNQVLRVNDPFRYDGIDHLLVLQGYSPHFILYRDGVPIDDVIVSLDFDHNYRDSFNFSGEGLRIVAQFFPDMARTEEGKVYTKSRRPKNPYFGFDILKEGKSLFRGLVARGEGAAFGSYELVFQGLRHWISLSLVKETGIGFFFVCAMIGLMGVALRVLDPERRITVRIGGTGERTSAEFCCSGKHFDGLISEYMADRINRLEGLVEESIAQDAGKAGTDNT